MADRQTLRIPHGDRRLTPWILHDLPRVAWIVELRAATLTDEERRIVREAGDRMLRAVARTPAA